MKNKTNRFADFCFWGHKQAPPRVSIRNQGAARPSRSERRQGAAGEARPQRPVPVPFRQAVSRNAACWAASTTAPTGTTSRG